MTCRWMASFRKFISISRVFGSKSLNRSQECDRSGGWDHGGCWHLGPARRDAACRIHPIHGGAHWSVGVYGHHG